MRTDPLLSRDLAPDALIRQGIRRLLRQRLRDENRGSAEPQQAREIPAGLRGDWFEQVTLWALDGMTLGHLQMTWPDGRRRFWGTSGADLQASIRVLRPDYYFSYCEAAFAMRNIAVLQMVYTRPNNLSL